MLIRKVEKNEMSCLNLPDKSVFSFPGSTVMHF